MLARFTVRVSFAHVVRELVSCRRSGALLLRGAPWSARHCRSPLIRAHASASLHTLVLASLISAPGPLACPCWCAGTLPGLLFGSGRV